MGIKFQVNLYWDRAGSSGDGDGGGGRRRGPTPRPASGLAPSPSLDPAAAVSTSSLPLHPARRPPLTPIVKYTDDGPDDDDDDDCPPKEDGTDWEAGQDDEDEALDDDDDWHKDEDDEGWEVMQDDEDELPDDEKLYIPLFMSAQKRNLPHDLVRHDSVPLNKNEYFSLRKNWNELLDGKRTYLRPLKDCRVLSVGGVFRCLDAHPRTLGCQENLGQMQDSQAEVTRLMEHVAVSRENFCRLKWDKAYFLNPEEYFSSVVSELNHLVNSVANGLSSEELFKRSLQEIMPLRIISLLRLLAETEIRTREVDYKSFIPGNMNVHEYGCKEVRPLDVKPTMLAMRALTYALGIPVRLEIIGRDLAAGDLQVKRLDFFPRSESGKGAFHMVQSYWPSTTTPEPLELGSGNLLLSSDGTPSLTLLCRPEDCDILYRK